MTTDPAALGPQKPPFWRDLRVLRIAGQAVVVVFVVILFAWLWSNLQANVDDGRIPPPTDFSYLDQPIGQSIAGSDLRPTQSRRDALQVGVERTIQIAIVGIILTTVLGILLGIARLSTNWLAATFARVYVEVFRNTPPLVVIIFIFLGLFLNSGLLPNAVNEEAIEIPGLLTANTRTIAVPGLSIDGGLLAPLGIVLAALVIAVLVSRWRRRVQDSTGTPARSFLWGGGAFLTVAIVGWLALGGPVTITTPNLLDNGRATEGGYQMQVAYCALLVGLVLYTASHIAEIVRAAIQSVARGQDEAAKALGLPAGLRLRKVILPQALRVAIPPMANQYLNLTKNSSLAIAVAYVEATKITSDIVANGAPAVQSFGLLVVIYLVISLVTAAITNYANARLAVPGRS